MPSSMTEMTVVVSCEDTSKATLPFSGVNLMALDNKLFFQFVWVFVLKAIALRSFVC